MKRLCMIPVLAVLASCSNNVLTSGEKTAPPDAAPLRSSPYCDSHGLNLGQTKEAVMETLRGIIARDDNHKKQVVALDTTGKELLEQNVLVSDNWRFKDIITSFSGAIVTLEFESNVLVRITEGHLR